MSFESALGVGKLGLGSAGSVLVKDRGGHVAMTGRGRSWNVARGLQRRFEQWVRGGSWDGRNRGTKGAGDGDAAVLWRLILRR